MNETEIERMVLRLQADVGGYESNLRHARAATEQTAQSVEMASRRVEGLTFRLNSFGQTALSTITQLGLAMTGIGSIRMAVNMAAQTEQMEISLGTMLKSAEAGKQMIGDLIEMAAKTPMTLPGLLEGTKTLLQFGVAGAEVIPTLQMIGDVVGGDEAKFRQLALAFGQMKGAGRLMGQERLQMINAGFNPLDEMKRTTGKSIAELTQMMEHGQISVKMVEDAFRSATSAGGSFFGLMEKQSKSFTGLMSTMTDDLGAFMRQLGNDLIEGLKLKELVAGISSVAQAVTAWLAAVDPETKKMVLGIVAAVAAIAGLIASAMLLEIMFSPLITMFQGAVGMLVGMASNVVSLGAGLLGLLNPLNLVKNATAAYNVVLAITKALLSPVTLAITAVLALAAGSIGVLIDKAGGIKDIWDNIGSYAIAAWETVRDAVVSFWEFVRPIMLALGGVLSAVWDTLKDAALGFWEMVSGMWSSIFGETKITWEGIRDTIVNALLHVEHFFRNKMEYITYWSLRFQLGWAEAIDWVKDGIVGLMAFFSGFGAGLVELFKATFDKISGLFTGNTVEIKARVTKAFDDAFEATRVHYGGGVEDPATRELRRQVQQQEEVLGTAFAEFRNRRLREMGIVPTAAEQAQAARVAYQTGQETGAALTQGMHNQVSKLDAALINSVEGITRLSAYRDLLSLARGAGVGGAAASAIASTVRPSTESSLVGPVIPGMRMNRPASGDPNSANFFGPPSIYSPLGGVTQPNTPATPAPTGNAPPWIQNNGVMPGFMPYNQQIAAMPWYDRWAINMGLMPPPRPIPLNGQPQGVPANQSPPGGLPLPQSPAGGGMVPPALNVPPVAPPVAPAPAAIPPPAAVVQPWTPLIEGITTLTTNLGTRPFAVAIESSTPLQVEGTNGPIGADDERHHRENMDLFVEMRDALRDLKDKQDEIIEALYQ